MKEIQNERVVNSGFGYNRQLFDAFAGADQIEQVSGRSFK
jgi:hypothetical protein